MQNNIFASHAPDLIASGFSVIPASGKRPLIKGWTEFCSRIPNEKEISDWSKSYPDANISLCMGSASSLVAVDYDYDIAGEHKAIQTELPETPLLKQGKKGHTAFYKYSGETNRSFAKDGKTSIDILSLNKF